MLLKIWGVINGDYFEFLGAKIVAGEYELPRSLSAWARAKRLSMKYGYKFGPGDEGE